MAYVNHCITFLCNTQPVKYGRNASNSNFVYYFMPTWHYDWYTADRNKNFPLIESNVL